ncbi:NAD-dependent epimerase/dehydratase family protein [Sulfurimonas sp.]|jgi:nucleoside-diphosphate-sugar epimerase|uniref:NAD-dependent epimerase/dehydratase family protein n=1 Tax=Sulfurimonas sp. TaxID=2022749 RepID=UPI0025CE8774|nr:NAD-dependent epimerase/dehydratase family protein [Sulfurimonas sp.]MBT5935906.1 NAD-dependent epimerase/dehydratase family protein [Sulfurimonas sp.]
MSLLITGANGFVAGYFLKKYSRKYKIIRFSFRNDDLAGLDLTLVDTIIHLSALVHQMGGASKEEYEKVNVTQTLDLAKKAKESGVEHFIFMSSVKVFGEESDGVYNEQTECHPQDEYGVSKLNAELELTKLEDDSFRVSIIRTPIVYGHGVKANIKNLVSLVNKVSILPFADIENKRSMVYIGNLCHLVDMIIEKKESGIFLASDDEAISTTRLIELIAKELDKKIYLVKIPFFETLLKVVKPSFHKRLYGSLEVDNTLTMKRLFGEAKATLPYSVEDGIRLMIQGIK